MDKVLDLKRFIEAQEPKYATALKEIENGKKTSHWMWYIFPQLKHLGRSDTAQFYGIENKAEAEAFAAHPVLGSRLINISKALLALTSNNATQILGSPDDLKLQSCMTLFSALPSSDPVFEMVLQKFYQGKKDDSTLAFIKA